MSRPFSICIPTTNPMRISKSKILSTLSAVSSLLIALKPVVSSVKDIVSTLKSKGPK